MISRKNSNIFCSEPIENIENYERAVNDSEHKLHCHHRGEILPCGNYSMKTLKQFGLYYKRPAYELIFLPDGEHMRLHHRGNKHSEEHKKKISEALSDAMKGNKNRTGKNGYVFTEEHRRKLSEARKRYLAERRKRIINNV